MAAHLRDDVLHGRDHDDVHASDNRWRHQESGAYAKHAGHKARGADSRQGSADLATYLHKSRADPASNGTNTQQGNEAVEGRATEGNSGTLEVRCGPLLNYRRMEEETWFGSVLIVLKGGGLGESPKPTLILKTDVAAANRVTDNGGTTDGPNPAGQESYGTVNGVDYSGLQKPRESAAAAINGGSHAGQSEGTKIPGTKLYSDPNNTFWRFDLRVPMQQNEIRCEYSIPDLTFAEGKKTDKQTFFVPAISESMRIMFHSCNGFSVGTDEEAWSGAALWNDVQRVHKVTPFHVMLGGGDQIYNDGIRVHGPLRPWTDMGNPRKRREHPFPEELRKKCDDYYVENYVKWYCTEPFAGANGQIPQLNLWDDHDIIDGFGSYTDDFMSCPVFRGIGGVANKYYLLFQHHLAPPVSSYTTDAPQTTSTTQTPEPDPRQLENTFVLKEEHIDSSYIIGAKPGPYVVDHSRSIYARLGSRIAFFGIDARTERTRHQVNYPETYDIIFDRLRKDLGAAQSSSSPIHHLIVLLGIPIAYPRLTWLENIFSSPLMGPLKFMNKRFGFGGSFFNHFDGSVDLLDDLDDHYTARTHKKERLFLVQSLQKLASEFSVRITILGGDVHLAAVGRFYSNLDLEIPIPNDHRYMANIISSAIVNKPPPQAVANLLARRNKLHHLDPNTDETLMKFFDKSPGKISNNHVTMPSRNWAMITENAQPSASLPASNGTAQNGDVPNGTQANGHDDKMSKPKDGHSWLGKGELDAGSNHKAANSESHGKGTDGSLDVCIRVEKDQHDKEGTTQGYGMSIPKLTYENGPEFSSRRRDAVRHPRHGKLNQPKQG